MRKLTAFILALLMVFSLTTQAFAATVSMEADKQAISAGEQIVVTVKQNEVLENAIGAEYRVYYNPNLFELTGSELAAKHDLGRTLSDAKGTYQVINYLDTTSAGAAIPAGNLAVLTFTAKADLTQEQSADFELVNAGVMDVNNNMIEDNTVDNGTVSITVTPAVPETKTYTVTLPKNCVGYTITPTEGSVSPVTENGSFSFTVTVDTENYEGTPVVKAGETKLTAVNGIYTIEGITANQTVTVEGITQKVVEPATYTVTLPKTTVGYTITPAAGSVSPVAEFGSFSFTVTVDTENYEGTPVVKANGLTLSLRDGMYTISNITEDQVVTVDGIKEQGLVADKVIYKNGSNGAQWPNGAPVFIDSMTVKGLAVTDVQWDASYTTCTVTLYKTTAADASFKLGTQLGYSAAPQMMAQFDMRMNGSVKQTFSNSGYHEYSGNLVNGEAEITVNTTMMQYKGDKTIRLVVDNTAAPEPASYNVTLTEGEGYSFAAAEGSVSPVTEGGNYSFTVTVDTDNYEGTPVVKANGTKLTAENGVYTVANITSDVIVTVEGITAIPNTYTVTLTEGVGYTIAAADGSSSPVTEGGNYSFTVTVDTDNYEGTPVVKANGTKLTAENGVYTVANITSDVNVTVEGITLKPNTYTVTLTQGEGYTIAAAEDSVSPVTEGGNFSFTVTLKNGYEGTILVNANGFEIPLLNGVYTIEEITKDQVVTVEGVTLKPNTYKAEASADVTTTENGEVTVSVKVPGNSNTDIAGYNDYDVTLKYDPAVLEYVSATAAHDGAEITHDADAGTVRVIGHGDEKAFSVPVVTLNFKAVESGIHDVTITSAKIDNSGNAIGADAPKAAVSDQATAVIVAYPVDLPQNFAGEATVLPNGDYAFTAPNAYYDITVTVGGVKVEPDVNGLTYTVSAVNGDVQITATGKTYKVTKTGTNATIQGGDTAQYGENYSFTVETVAGYAVDAVTVMIGETSVNYTISGDTYMIIGSDIKGDLTITATAVEQAANTTKITFEGVDADEVVGGLTQYATNGQDFTFELNEEEGYVYTVMLGDEELKAVSGVYTIPGEKITGAALTITITKEVYSFDPEVSVSKYIQLDGTVMWLVTATEGENKLAYGEGNTMFWSDKYNAYCYLVVSAQSEEDVLAAAKAAIVAADEEATVTAIAYDYDVNQTNGTLDVNDAQLTYDMYQARKYSGFTAVTMDKFLEADVNGDKIVNVDDAAAVVAQLLK